MSSFLKKVFFVFLIAGVIFSIIGVSNYFVEKKFKKIEGVLPKIPEFQLPQELPKIENFKDLKDIKSFKEEGAEKKEFISEDKKLRLEYTSEWLEIEPERAKNFFSEELLQNYNGKIHFFAEKFSFGGIAILFVQEFSMQRETEIDDAIEEMKKNNEGQGRTMEILKIEKKDNEAVFEAKYKGKYETHTKEKIFLLEPEDSQRKIFLIVFMTLEKDWKGLEKDGERIINSAGLIK